MKGRSRPRRSSAAVLRGAGSHATFDHVVVGGRHSVGTRLRRERTQGGGHRDSLSAEARIRATALFASGVTRGAAREWPGECGATREARQRRKKVAISHATGDTVQRRESSSDESHDESVSRADLGRPSERNPDCFGGRGSQS